jgi:uncharacterized membrane protein
MKSKVLPMPHKEAKVSIKPVKCSGVGYQISVGEQEFISIAVAAGAMCISKEAMMKIVEEKKMKKYDETPDSYLLLMDDLMDVMYPE